MYNWSVDEKALKKADPQEYKLWKLEQTINYGEPGEKIPARLTKKYWGKLRIDPLYRSYLAFLLWPKRAQKRTQS